MRNFVFAVMSILIFACHAKPGNYEKTQLDSLNKTVPGGYKPGMGEFMSGVQVHHAKLWFAGQNQNWQLADFEIQEIIEILDDIEKYNAERPEVKSIGMIHPALDSVKVAIQQRNSASFKKSFILLTNTCNNCHQATGHGFNVIKIPDSPPYSNQDFKRQAASGE